MGFLFVLSNNYKKIMKYNGSKIGLGVVLILLSFFTVGDISFSGAEAIGFSVIPIGLIVGGIYLIYKGTKSKNQ